MASLSGPTVDIDVATSAVNSTVASPEPNDTFPMSGKRAL